MAKAKRKKTRAKSKDLPTRGKGPVGGSPLIEQLADDAKGVYDNAKETYKTAVNVLEQHEAQAAEINRVARL